MNKFIEVTDIANNTFLINVSQILYVRSVVGQPTQLQLTIKSLPVLDVIVIQAEYAEFKYLLE